MTARRRGRAGSADSGAGWGCWPGSRPTRQGGTAAAAPPCAGCLPSGVSPQHDRLAAPLDSRIQQRMPRFSRPGSKSHRRKERFAASGRGPVDPHAGRAPESRPVPPHALVLIGPRRSRRQRRSAAGRRRCRTRPQTPTPLLAGPRQHGGQHPGPSPRGRDPWRAAGHVVGSGGGGQQPAEVASARPSTLLSLCLKRDEDSATASPTLVPCPASMLVTWEREVECFPLSLASLSGRADDFSSAPKTSAGSSVRHRKVQAGRGGSCRPSATHPSKPR